MNIRMLPIRATFEKFRRLVHDLARDLGKDVELTMEGADTELDKTVIDQLGDPLMHLIRNSMDHGIGSPAVRAAHGKRPTAASICRRATRAQACSSAFPTTATASTRKRCATAPSKKAWWPPTRSSRGRDLRPDLSAGISRPPKK
jgi:hypothetical protein